MKRIAVVFEEEIFDQKGSFRAKLERCRQLMRQSGFETDVWCIQLRYSWIERRLLGKRTLNGVSEVELGCPDTIDFGGVTFRMLWLRYSIVDHFLFFKLRVRPWFYPAFLRRKTRLFGQYDLISAHGFEGAFLAREAEKAYGIPYCVSWHGSDIHTKPFKYRCIRGLTASLLAGARMNFFVSRALLDKSEEVGPGKKMVLYNGCDASFRRLPDAERAALRSRNGVPDDTLIIGFAGSLVPVKNAELLPELFGRIQAMSARKMEFWILGDGPLRSVIQRKMQVPCRFWGNVPMGEMPGLFNAMDLIVLPSQREALSLVLIEAVSCGCKAVGSAVGGIPEVLGPEYCVPLGEAFAERFARKAIQVLGSGEEQKVPGEMSWLATARKEIGVYEKILKEQ